LTQVRLERDRSDVPLVGVGGDDPGDLAPARDFLIAQGDSDPREAALTCIAVGTWCRSP
jgi:hypothetical protein